MNRRRRPVEETLDDFGHFVSSHGLQLVIGENLNRITETLLNFMTIYDMAFLMESGAWDRYFFFEEIRPKCFCTKSNRLRAFLDL